MRILSHQEKPLDRTYRIELTGEELLRIWALSHAAEFGEFRNGSRTMSEDIEEMLGQTVGSLKSAWNSLGHTKQFFIYPEDL